ncbi:uncharacterized protein LOC115587642 [Sparus aurata]|uniref:uncharacterized protein LOC115587642 n=1 Tax=Sparus aurata TaxID=8175 RepID=UPI0011C17D39|nr:uncharacterized protein LOC115587642 [Sparus aurata]
MAEQRGAAEKGSSVDGDEEDTTQQDADSHSVKCPTCGSSFIPKVEVGEEPAEVLPEQVDVDPEILKELRAVYSTSYKYPVDDEGLKKCINKTSIDLKKLLNFFKDVAALHENTEKGEGNDSSDDQMEEDTTQQDADSESGESPESRSSGRDTVDVAGEEAVEVHPEQVDVDPEILKKLRAVMSKSYKYLDDEGLKECIRDASVDPQKLLQFFKNVEARYKNTDQGQKPSWWSWSTGMSSTSQTVKVHSVTTGQTFGADDEILEKVKNMKWHTKVKITTDCQECDIIIVFCPITSRVGSDVEAAMRKIPAGDKRVILVLMHHTRRVDFSTDIKKWSETYQNVVLDVHVLFHETQPGLLKCPRNDEAVQQIQTVLKALSK